MYINYNFTKADSIINLKKAESLKIRILKISYNKDAIVLILYFFVIFLYKFK